MEFRRNYNENSDLQLISKLLLVSLSGVTVEMLRLRSGKTLIPVGVIFNVLGQLLIFCRNYIKLYTIEADLSRAPLHTLPKATGKGIFYRITYDIILLFGMTELKAQVAWMENVSGLHMLFQSKRFRIKFMLGF
jgi:hypothetical protein